MYAKKRRILLWLLLFTSLLVATAACTQRIRTGPVERTSETVERQDASQVDVEIRMGAGELTIGGGARDLLQADFAYNVADWQPEVSYEVNGGEGQLTVAQPDVNLDNFPIPDNDIRYEWDLQLNDDVPLTMQVNMGAGQSDLNLESLDLRSLTLETGAGDVAVNLGGTLTDLEMRTGAGQVDLNLNSEWTQDLDAQINSGIGELTVVLPDDVGVRVNVDQGLGNVNASGLSEQGGAYVNDAYGDSAITLEIDIEGGIGQVTLEVAG